MRHYTVNICKGGKVVSSWSSSGKWPRGGALHSRGKGISWVRPGQGLSLESPGVLQRWLCLPCVVTLLSLYVARGRSFLQTPSQEVHIRKKPFLCFAITLLSSVNVPNAAVSTFDFFFLIYETCKFFFFLKNTHIHANALLCGFRGLNFEK